MSVLLFGNPCASAKSRQDVTQGDYNLGIADTELVEGRTRSTHEAPTHWTLWAHSPDESLEF